LPPSRRVRRGAQQLLHGGQRGKGLGGIGFACTFDPGPPLRADMGCRWRRLQPAVPGFVASCCASRAAGLLSAASGARHAFRSVGNPGDRRLQAADQHRRTAADRAGDAGMRLRRAALAGFAAGLLLYAVSVGAVEAPAGTKNFTPPTTTPDYFSGEGGAFRGAATPHPITPTTAAPAAVVAPAEPRDEGVQEQRYMTRRSYTTTRAAAPAVRRDRGHSTRREAAAAPRRRGMHHGGIRTAARGRVVHDRPAAHRAAGHAHAAASPAARGRKLARAGR